MLAWETLCTPKGIGGLRFRNLKYFNLVLLGRQMWRLINCEDTLCFNVLSAKYFPDGDILNAKHVDKSSYAWTSILEARKAFVYGFGWHIGDGIRARIACENWGFEGLNDEAIRDQNLVNDEMIIHDL